MDQLERALSLSRQIGMALGILIERHKITEAEAFRLLVAASQRENVKLRHVAGRLVLTGSLAD
ncbi:ANTAR domain-containing protein [Modestobacter altitudinis]|uniref:ANTAR domain-containing protein n=1 Tax=Modestobacter altitudinis TaxID=2213158 RepID=UPI001FE92B55|nr:ANTAR domain-containing protein [Modestobacter altitudinis]